MIHVTEGKTELSSAVVFFLVTAGGEKALIHPLYSAQHPTDKVSD